MEALLADLKYGARMLAKTPGLTLVAVLAIALGVGLTTHTFSVVYGSVIRGLDIDQGSPLVAISEDVPSQGRRGGWIPYLDLLDYRAEQTAFRGLAALSMGVTVNLADEDAPPERYEGARVSANLFEQVDRMPLLGRVFTEAEERGETDQVAIISWDVWQNRYAADPEIVGTSIRVNSERATIVGVMPEGFHFPFSEDVWLPLGISQIDAQRGQYRYLVVGRLAEGVSIEQADAQMQAIAARIAAENPETNEGVQAWVQTYEDYQMPPELVSVLWVMLLAVFGVLLIACFNVANLLLARSTVRAREVAVRSALGADRGRIIRQLLLEAGMLAVAGGLLGILLAKIGVDAFNASILDIEKPYWIQIRLDAAALVFTLALVAFTSLAAGVLPAVRASGGKIHEILQDESRGSSGLRLGRFSNVLVIGEIALSCALLVAAGMMIKSVINVNTVDLGFDEQGIFTGRIALFEADYPDDEAARRFYDRLLEVLRSDPDVVDAGLTSVLPGLGSATTRVAIEGIDYAEERDMPVASSVAITPGYLDVLGGEVLDGRDFGTQDRDGAVPVALVNQSFAERHFGSGSALERRFRAGRDGPWLTVVGVVPDIHIGGNGAGGLTRSAEMTDQFLVPIAQRTGQRFVSVAVRTRGEPGAFSARAQEAVSRIDPSLPIYWMRTMEESIATNTWAFMIFGSLFTIFGAAALFLAAVGLYGVMAFSVGRRTQEMGIRMAMGAGTRSIFGLVLRKGMVQLGAGAAVGLGIGALLARPLAFVFYDVEPSDPLVYAAILATMALAGLAACVVPARRATRVELVEALRPE